MKCNLCEDTGWYGDNYPGIRYNTEYIPWECRDKRCSCYDNECRDVVDHFECFMGDEYVGGVADGYCPWLV